MSESNSKLTYSELVIKLSETQKALAVSQAFSQVQTEILRRTEKELADVKEFSQAQTNKLEDTEQTLKFVRTISENRKDKLKNVKRELSRVGTELENTKVDYMCLHRLYLKLFEEKERFRKQLELSGAHHN